MSEASALLAVGSDFEYKGRKMHLRPFTLKDEAIYESWLEEQAYNGVFRLKSRMEPDDYKVAISAVASDVAAGQFEFMSIAGQKSLRSPSGIKKVLLMTLEYSEKRSDDFPIDEEFVDKLYNEKLSEVINYIERCNSDPKLRAEMRRQRRKERRDSRSAK